ncbi:MAG: glycosyltransferase, partial [Saprospiraceae bacterium]
WELLIVDDASNDETPALLQFFQEKNPRLRVVRLAEKKTLGKKAALAQGVAAARYEHLLLTDADCAPVGPHWLAVMAGSLAATGATEIALGYAPLLERPGLLNKWARFETAYTALQYFAFAKIGMPYMGVGRNLAWKRPLFRQAGGFVRHADLPSGDDDLLVNAVARRGQVALCLNPAAFVYSEAKTTWAAWLRQKQRQLGSGLRYKWFHQVVLGAVAASQTLHYFFALLLLLADFRPGWVLGIWLLRLLFVLPVWRRVLRGFQEQNLLAWVPLLDILLAIYYAGFVPFAFLGGQKKVRWK